MSRFIEHNPKELDHKERHNLLLSAVAPRPIGFTSSVDGKGKVNLAPFSFHNAFSSNPPIIGISPAYSGKTGKIKNTLSNILDTKEFALSVVNYDMVEQMNLCAADFPKDVNEFEKSGLTPHKSKIISVPGVAESPIIMECKFVKHIEFSNKPGSGNLILGEVVYFHSNKNIILDSGHIDPDKMDQVSRLGMNWYSRANSGLFELPAPRNLPIGVDALPKAVREHPSFTGKLLARLASVSEIPKEETIDELIETYSRLSNDEMLKIAAALTDSGKIFEAWQLLYLAKSI